MSSSPSPAQPDWRPRLHFTAPDGWLNDPNGLVRLHGTWHLHYQYLTPRCWGHATSPDLFRWTDQPVALRPDALGDCWSGATVHDPDNTSGFFAPGFRDGLVSVYTSQNSADGQRISLASSSDGGVTWQCYAGNPVLRGPTAGFRDPKVFWHAPAGHWVLVLTENVHFTFFASDNLRDWRETGRFTPTLVPGSEGYDCPDVFPLPVEGDASRARWVFLASYVSNANFTGGFGVAGQRYWIGDFDGRAFVPEIGVEPWLRFGAGPDEYAAIVWPQETDGARRTLIIGWMNHWGYATQIPTPSWQGCMTLPRELRLHALPDGGCELRQAPARELWSQPHDHTLLPLRSLTAGAAPVPLGRSQCGAVRFRFRASADTALEIALFASDTCATRVGYEAERRCVYFDRRDAGAPDFHPAFPVRQETFLPATAAGEPVELLVIFDHSTIEVFAGDGAVYLAGQTLPSAGADACRLRVCAGHAVFESAEQWTFHAPARRSKSAT